MTVNFSNICFFYTLVQFNKYRITQKRLTPRVPLVEQELLTIPQHLSWPPVFSWVRVNRSLVLCVCFVDRCLSFCTFSIVLSVLLRFTDSDYHFGIFKLFLCKYVIIYVVETHLHNYVIMFTTHCAWAQT